MSHAQDSITIPLCGTFSDSEEAKWLETLSRVTYDRIARPEPVEDTQPKFHIAPLRTLSDTEKHDAPLLIAANPTLSEIESLPNIKWIQSLWAGVENSIQATAAKNIPLVRMVDPGLAATMSEAVLTWVLYLHRKMHIYHRNQGQKVWQQEAFKTPQDTTVGILGLGALGQAAASRLHVNHFKVIGWSRSLKNLSGITCTCGPKGLHQLLQESDIVVCLTPLTQETKHLLNTDTFQVMKPGACVINFARGAVIHTDSLRTALNTETIEHAVLDVFEHEPLPQESWMWSHPRISILPHISAPTNPETASGIVIDHIMQFFAKGTIPQAVDPIRGY